MRELMPMAVLPSKSHLQNLVQARQRHACINSNFASDPELSDFQCGQNFEPHMLNLA